ncbi:cell filamentation protein Fic [Gordonia sp. HNM0687]|uniref:protein adenylyltransferase n=1 Tax=Gordonia mangrovi TaxID=2665643 RepID=A0A6L7GN19_9ACTN|nr:Fic family protein [Gordonia mangrovi]MXP20135.1 cell filamentation protein Fic [Gordonia mangrovi]UVF79257.1 Fic family protein [Gordonia mangrovi]
MARPWDTGDLDQNWSGYFIPGTEVLRNRVGATMPDDLRDAENDLVEVRVLELREAPEIVGRRTYYLDYLCAIHRQLFQDVYDWAGELRTVGIEKDDEAFCPPGNIAQPMVHVAREIHRLGRLRSVARPDLPRVVTYLYDYVNFAHPFREGNGRSTREFFDLLLSERAAGLDWQRTDLGEMHDACHAARGDQDLSLLEGMFGRILDSDPAYDF